MARSATCRACGKTIRPKAKDMSVGAAARLHYWRWHREIMLPSKTKTAAAKPKRRAGR